MKPRVPAIRPESLPAAVDRVASRSLALLDGPQPRVIRFPDESVGTITWERDDDASNLEVEAAGNVVAPPCSTMDLEVKNLLLLHEIPWHELAHHCRRIFFGLNLADDGLRHLKSLTNLTDLDLSATQVTDEGLRHLKSLTSLTYLNLSDTQTTERGRKSLSHILIR